MRLPHHLLESLLFLFTKDRELIIALGSRVTPLEKREIRRLSKKGLPPVTSVHTLSTMIGINPGIVWSFVNRARKHYRIFTIPKGKKERIVVAPRVGLKIIQKWLAHHISIAACPLPHVFGFVRGKTHIDAAFQHRHAEWAFSVDITNFFPSTPADSVVQAFKKLGYNNDALQLLAALTCLNGFLPQGAPTSPVLSNLCFNEIDLKLAKLALRFDCELTRYADDITYSGLGAFPPLLREELYQAFSTGPWRLAMEKEKLQPSNGRIKIHGILVGQGKIRLTKGYRNKLRAYQHILATHGPVVRDSAVLKGHVAFSSQFERRVSSLLADLDNNNPAPIDAADDSIL